MQFRKVVSSSFKLLHFFSKSIVALFSINFRLWGAQLKDKTNNYVYQDHCFSSKFKCFSVLPSLWFSFNSIHLLFLTISFILLLLSLAILQKIAFYSFAFYVPSVPCSLDLLKLQSISCQKFQIQSCMIHDSQLELAKLAG